MAALPTPSAYPGAVPPALPPPANVETKETVPAPPQAAEDAEALRLAVCEAEAVALHDSEREDERDADRDRLAVRVAEAMALLDIERDDVRDDDRDCDTLELPTPTRRDDEMETVEVRVLVRDTVAESDAVRDADANAEAARLVDGDTDALSVGCRQPGAMARMRLFV